MDKILIKGTFGEKSQKILYFSGRNNIYYFFVHGLYGSCFDNRYLNLAKKLNRKNYNVLLLDRSRLPGYKLSFSFETKQKFFIGKTFRNEIEDLKIAYDYSQNNIIKKKSLVNLVGFSLGGTLISYLINDYKNYLNSIFLFGTGVSTKNKNRPIVSSYPRSREILRNFSRFDKSIILVQGSKDSVIDGEEAKKIIFNRMGNFSTRILILLEGVDHQFKKLFDKDATELLEEKIFNILTLNL